MCNVDKMKLLFLTTLTLFFFFIAQPLRKSRPDASKVLEILNYWAVASFLIIESRTIPDLNSFNQNSGLLPKREGERGLWVFMYVLYVCETRGVHEQPFSPPPANNRPPGALPYSLIENKTGRQWDITKNFRPFQTHFVLQKEKKKSRGLSDKNILI